MKQALLLTLLALCGAAHAETLFEYGRQCAEQVTEIPAFNCMAGEEIPITVDGKPVAPGTAPATCDRPSLLPQTNAAGQPAQCVTGTRALVLRDDKTAQISAICRKKEPRPPGSPLFDEINVVSHNLKNGKTCWFTAKTQNGQPIDGRWVPSPSTFTRKAPPASPDGMPAKAADSVWLTPHQLVTQEPACIRCHDSGPFMYSPYIAQTTKLPGDPFGFYEPKAIGEDIKRAWASLNAFGITTRGNTCTACHRMGNMNSCQVAMQQSTGNAPQQGGNEWSKRFPQSHWMSPGNLHSQAQWNEQFADSLKRLAACCENPQGAGCKVVAYGPKAAKR
jgi:hypothetical protein